MSDKPVEAQKSVPLSSEAQDAKEAMQQQLVRKMAIKMIAEAEEQERQRRIKEEKEPHPEDAVRKRALDQIITVQEDLVRALNRMKVKEAEEIEKAQRITEEKKHAVHDELLRKAAAEQVKKQEEEERTRRIEESKDPSSAINTERYKTYDKLVMVQEDLLHHVKGLKADAAMKEEQQRRITEENKHIVQEELMHKMSQKQAAAAEEKERERRVDEIEHLSEADAKHRLDIAHKMLDVQKELLATHPPIQAIHGTLSQQVLEDAKVYMQEQLLRKAAQKAADEAMDAEQKRRIAEAKDTKESPYSEAKSDVLSELSRKAAIKEAKELANTTQQEYIRAEQKARVEEDTVRKVHQKQADAAMQKEQKERIAEMESKPPHFVSDSLKKEIKEHGHAQ